MDYVIAVQAPAYPMSPSGFAVESAFAEHLEALRLATSDGFARVVLIAPMLGETEYRAQRRALAVIGEDSGIALVPAPSASRGVGGYWLRDVPAFRRRLRGAMATAGVVQVDLATDIRRPTTALVGRAAWRLGRPVVFVTDIDYRRHAARNRRLGRWGLGKYLANRFVIQPFKSMQIRFAVRHYALVLLKGEAMVRDFGQGRPHVRNFYDTVHGEGQILTDMALSDRMATLLDPAQRLQLVHFGRLVDYKGIDRMIAAVGILRDSGREVRLTIIGEGPSGGALRAQVDAAGLGDHVAFAPAISYGAPLFDRLATMHAMLAAPLVEDTPRAVFDAMARGLPVVAFDIDYFRGLERASGAIALATWPEAAALAEAIAALDGDRGRLAAMAERGVAFARQNTQASWLAKRIGWIRAVRSAPPAAGMAA